MYSMTAAPYEVLLVDDEPGDVELIRTALRESRFTCNVTTARDGQEALSLLTGEHRFGTGEHPDLIFLDLNMPRKSGHELLRDLKASPVLARIPVVVLTTSIIENDVMQSYDLGAKGYLTKPSDMDQMFRAVHDVLDYWFDAVRGPRQR